MATKKRLKVPSPSPEDAKSPDNEANVETMRDMNVDADVERIASDASPEIGSVEGPGDSTYRIDIENGSEADSCDVERGPV
jgi:hypothetical protein